MKASPPPSRRPAPAVGSAEPPFRFGGLLSPLIDAGYEDDAREVLEIYLEDHAIKFDEIQRALEEGDLVACEQAVHMLIGSAGGIGASDLASALALVEKACRLGDAERVRETLRVLEAEKERVFLAAKRYLAEEALGE